jgi:peptide/nickel transport system permease protein
MLVAIRLVAGRVATALPLVALVILIAFSLIHLAPGNPAYVLAGDAPSPAVLAAVTEEYDLDSPVATQLATFFGHALRGDFGQSIYYRRPVFSVIVDRLPATLLLTFAATTLSSVLGIWIGVFCAAHAGSRRDTAVGMVAMVGYSVPGFWLAQLLVLVFAAKLRWLPTLGMTSSRTPTDGVLHVLDILHHLILPAITLAIFMTATIARYTRTAMIEALSQEYVEVARTKGLSGAAILRRHALPNSLVPIVTVIGLEFGGVLSGAVVTEIVYGWPGLGRLFYDAVFRRDFPLMIAAFIFSCVAVIVVNTLSDLLAILIDPRLR